MDCLREVTLAFPEQGSVWATRLSVKVEPGAGPKPKEELHVALEGKAAGDQPVNDLSNRLQGNPRLSDLKRGPILKVGTGARGGSTDVSFRNDFSYPGAG